jgi:hypothetical protein
MSGQRKWEKAVIPSMSVCCGKSPVIGFISDTDKHFVQCSVCKRRVEGVNYRAALSPFTVAEWNEAVAAGKPAQKQSKAAAKKAKRK